MKTLIEDLTKKFGNGEEWFETRTESTFEKYPFHLDTILNYSNNEFNPDEIVEVNINDNVNDIHKDFTVTKIYGGKNGTGVWSDYLLKLRDICKAFEINNYRCWIIDLDIDVVDDVWTCYLGVESGRSFKEICKRK